MLLELAVRKLAIIDDLRFRLGPGLNVLTGQTGAGKTILVGALALALGARASAETIRRGEDQAEIEAVFDLSGLQALKRELAEEGLIEDGLLIVRRIIALSGRHRVFIGGRSMPAARLQEIGEKIVNVYGQHESRGLLQSENHLGILDESGGLEGEKESFTERYRALVDLRDGLSDLVRKDAESASRENYLNFILREIEAARFAPGEDKTLQDRRRILASAEKLAAVASDIAGRTYESEESFADVCGKLSRRAAEAARVDPAFEKIAQAVEGLCVGAMETGRTAREYLDRLSLDPRELENVENRLETIRLFSKKYGGSLEAVLKTVEDAKVELAGLTGLGTAVAAMTDRVRKAEAELSVAAAALTAKRKKAAKDLSARVCAELAELGMKGTVFEVAFSPVPSDAGIDLDGARLDPDGAERCEFLLCANPGEEPRPLARIASGGELSRIMLAIKSSLAKVFYVPTLVFDEVDTGIGGAQAEIVGRKLKSVAGAHQVLCITHLPQIAGLADRHLLVEKQVRKGRTSTVVRELDHDERETEVARMVGGLKITDAARAAAREMIKHS